MVDVKRIDRLRQTKISIRGSNEHLIVGIDISKNKHYAFFGNANGKSFLKKFIFNNDLEGLSNLINKAETILQKYKLTEIVFGLESTANYHKPVAESLIRRGYMVVLLSSVAVKRNRELLDGRWDKNDKKDAANIADLISQGKCLYYDYPCTSMRSIRTLLSLKRKLTKQKHAQKMRIRGNIIAPYFPEMDAFFPYIENSCLAAINVCLAPKKLSEIEYTLFYKWVTSKPKNITQQKRLRELWEVSRHSIGCEVTDAVQFEASLMVESLQRTKTLLEMVEKKLEKERVNFSGYKYLLSIPGFGPAIATMTLGAIGDPHRFENGRQVLKLAGLDLSASRSGQSSMNAKAHISKKGKAELRYALYHAAFTASSRHKLFKNWFQLKTEKRQNEKGIGMKTRIKLSAKMLVIAWTLMKRQEPFNPEYFEDYNQD